MAGQKVCRFYNRPGGCRYGASCWDRHLSREEEADDRARMADEWRKTGGKRRRDDDDDNPPHRPAPNPPKYAPTGSAASCGTARPTEKERQCEFCTKFALLTLCIGCESVGYCSELCKKRDAATHDPECAGKKLLRSRIQRREAFQSPRRHSETSQASVPFRPATAQRRSVPGEPPKESGAAQQSLVINGNGIDHPVQNQKPSEEPAASVRTARALQHHNCGNATKDLGSCYKPPFPQNGLPEDNSRTADLQQDLPGAPVMQPPVRNRSPEKNDGGAAGAVRDPRLMRAQARRDNATAQNATTQQSSTQNGSYPGPADQPLQSTRMAQPPPDPPLEPSAANAHPPPAWTGPIDNAAIVRPRNPLTTTHPNPAIPNAPPTSTIFDNVHAPTLQIMIGDPFRRLRNKRWLFDRSPADIEHLLITSFRHRRHLNDIRKGIDLHILLPNADHLSISRAFRRFGALTHEAGLFPPEFTETIQQELAERVRQVLHWEVPSGEGPRKILDAMSAEDVVRCYGGDVQMPMQMRSFADQVMGRPVVEGMRVGEDVWDDLCRWEKCAWEGFEWERCFRGRF